jgi:hypothetical protein
MPSSQAESPALQLRLLDFYRKPRKLHKRTPPPILSAVLDGIPKYLADAQ